MQNNEVMINPNRAYLEISKEALIHNLKTIKSNTKSTIMAMVKCNGYGLGLVELASFYEQQGVTWLGVAAPDEALTLRQAGIQCSILLTVPQNDFFILRGLMQNNISIVADKPEQIKQIREIHAQTGLMPRLHLAIDTGMNRFGFKLDQLLQAVNLLGNLPIEGVFTHFSAAYPAKRRLFYKQLALFEKAIELIKASGYQPGLLHAAGSLAALNFPQSHFDLIRIGSALLGCVPNESNFGLKRTCHLTVPINRITSLKRGEVLGYNGFKLRRSCISALVLAGYSDGLALERFVRIHTLRDILYLIKRPPLCANVNGFTVKLIGGNGTNHTFLDVTNADAKPGDLVYFNINPLLVSSLLPRVYY